MLVLTRKIGELLLIGDDIRIVVLKIKRNQVSIGIEAPEHFKIYREKIYRRIEKEKQTKQDYSD